MKRTALYRHFDAAGALLYVGISNDQLRRLCQHKDRSHWHAQIAVVQIEWLPDRASAMDAEAKAIASERPAWNVQGRAKRLQPPKSVQATVRVASTHTLVGMFFHTFNDSGEIEYQAQVLAVEGDVVFAQMFSWFLGEPTDVRTFAEATLYSDRCRLYRNIDAWRRAGSRGSRIKAVAV